MIRTSVSFGYLITGERGTIFDWDKFKWSPTEPGEEGIVSTASGNDYYIHTDWRRTYIVNTRESERKGQLVAAYSKGIKAGSSPRLRLAHRVENRETRVDIDPCRNPRKMREKPMTPQEEPDAWILSVSRLGLNCQNSA